MLSRAERLRTIERLLYSAADGLSAVEISERTGVGRRTVYRDLELLSEGDVPIWQGEGRFGIIRDRYLTTVRLNFHEAVALFIAARLLTRLADENDPHIVSALTKLATALPQPLSEHVARTAAYVQSLPLDSRYVAVLEGITTAWARQRKVRLWYRSPRTGQVYPRDFAPYFIEPSGVGAGCYVIGLDDQSGELRTFKLERLDRVEALDERYDIPPDFDPIEHLAPSWGIMAGPEVQRVVLRFSPEAAPLLRERQWHRSQQVTAQPDGGCLFSVEVSQPREMVPWIRSWGAEVEVLEPPELRQALVDEARQLAERYKSNGPTGHSGASHSGHS
jgi:proteasome accessory factor B